MKPLSAASLLALLLPFVVTSPASAATEDPAHFYKNLQMKMIIRSEANGSYDTFGRLLARHMGRHIPGNPTIVPINMPGASGIKAANHVATIAPKDGSIITNVSFGFPGMQAMGQLGKVGADMRDFNWIGSYNATNQVLAVLPNSHARTLEDAKKRETLVGASTVVSTAAQLPMAFNVLLGTKFKVVPGYQGMGAMRLAIERGEIDGMGAMGWDDLKTDYSEIIQKGQMFVLIQVGMEKEPDLPNAPLLIDQAKDPELRAALVFISKANSSLGKPFATSPGVPPERVAVLRKAFDDMVLDPDFLTDAKRLHVEIRPIHGEQLQKLVTDIVETPPSVVAKAKAAMQTPAGARR
jgi:tripartite-type tricarboxylate transporter receptor subunit TctC